MASATAATPPKPHVMTDAKSTLTPPPSERKVAMDDAASSSDLSELDEPDDIGEIEPDHYYAGGRIPVFKPTMDQFRSFKKFIGKIDKYGMKSGIVKVVPPKEWRDTLPALDEAVKSIKVKNPIIQEFEGTQGTYVQKNIEKQRSYNLPQWRELSEASNHQPPARRGERRRNQDKAVRTSSRLASAPQPSTRKKPAAKTKKGSRETQHQAATETKPDTSRPMTPTSPDAHGRGDDRGAGNSVDDDTPTKAKGRQPKSVSSRRKYNRREAAEYIDEAAFEGFSYRITDPDKYTPERCEELERNYWKSITYNSPLYGADMPGSLFDDTTKAWNVAKLENLLDVLGQKVPGVNTAYLYLGMWKSTFAWHLEDVDLYSINYIHFGAPKQWYSISQEDARRFEAAMTNVWPVNAKACSQFLRHKTFLISPSLLQSQYNIRVNRLVHHEGEFVITFPYGYHSGYNLGYNCAESVNFATESWLEYGRVAKKCDCEDDSVWVDVNEIERKLRGEETDYEETDEEEEEEGDGPTNLPTPPESVEGKPKPRVRKRKRDQDGKVVTSMVKRIRVRIKLPVKEPCMLCPNDIPSELLLPTDNGNKAHRMCALYTPETYIEHRDGADQVCNVAHIDKARLDLKCNYCRSKRGACFQCSQKKCTRAYHPTCAAAAGVQVDMRDVPVYGEDGKEYTDIGIDFRCRFHRPKRSKNLDGVVLEETDLIRNYAKSLKPGSVVQMQYYKGEIFAGSVLENRSSEQMILVDILPKGDRVEVEWKWLLAMDAADSHLPVPSANARPLAEHPEQKPRAKLPQPGDDHPKDGEAFCDLQGPHIWSEFNASDVRQKLLPVRVHLDKADTIWYYLGESSTEAKAQYTEDPRQRRHNLKSIFLDTVRSPAPALTLHPPKRTSCPPPRPITQPGRPKLQTPPRATPAVRPQQPHVRRPSMSEELQKPYQYKPRIDHSYRFDLQGPETQQAFQQHANGKIGITTMSPPRPQTSSNSSPAAQWGARESSAKRPESLSAPRRLSYGATNGAQPYGKPEHIPASRSTGSRPMQLPRPHPPVVTQGIPQTPAYRFGAKPQTALQVSQRRLPAPVANMGCSEGRLGDAQARQEHFKHTYHTPTTSSGAQEAQPSLTTMAAGHNAPNLWLKYPYLSYCYSQRPSGPYVSPYLPGGGFADAFLPKKLQVHGEQQSQSVVGAPSGSGSDSLIPDQITPAPQLPTKAYPQLPPQVQPLARIDPHLATTSASPHSSHHLNQSLPGPSVTHQDLPGLSGMVPNEVSGPG